jgi:hypothetical protein
MPRLPTDPALTGAPTDAGGELFPLLATLAMTSSETHRVGLARAPDAPALTAQTKRAAGVWKAARLSPAERTLGTHSPRYPRRSERIREDG